MAGPDPYETARIQRYAYEMQLAMADRVGLFNTNKCGGGPAAGARLPMWIHYDANGSGPNREWMRIQNLSTFDVSLSGWRLRDQGHSWYNGSTYYTFPSYAVIRAGSYITVYPGGGVNNAAAGAYFLGVTNNDLFPSPDRPLAYPGKAMYLLDPQLDFRGWAIYPCLFNCAKPPVHIATVKYQTVKDYIDITTDPGVTSPVDLSGVELEIQSWHKELMPGTVLNPGETLRVFTARAGVDFRRLQYWGTPQPAPSESAFSVTLRTARAVVLDTVYLGPN